MLTFQTITINIEESPSEILSKVLWKSEKVKNVFFHLPPDLTSKKLVGEFNNEKFEVYRAKPFILNFYLPRVLVRGKFKINGKQTTLILKYRFGILTTTIYLCILYAILLFVLKFFNDPTQKSALNVFPAIILLISILWIPMLLEIRSTTKLLFKILNIKKNTR